jgi:hypothetical protein
MGDSSTLGYYSRKCHDFEFKTFYQCWNGHEERVNEEVKEEEDTIH